MKTIPRLQSMHSELLKEADLLKGRGNDDPYYTEEDYRRDKRRLAAIARESSRIIESIRYLETFPQEEILSEQFYHFRKKLQVIDDRFWEWVKTPPQRVVNKTLNQKKAYWERLNEVPKIRKYIDTLRFILS